VQCRPRRCILLRTHVHAVVALRFQPWLLVHSRPSLSLALSGSDAGGVGLTILGQRSVGGASPYAVGSSRAGSRPGSSQRTSRSVAEPAFATPDVTRRCVYRSLERQVCGLTAMPVGVSDRWRVPVRVVMFSGLLAHQKHGNGRGIDTPFDG
jgi:hypothetical protein